MPDDKELEACIDFGKNFAEKMLVQFKEQKNN